MFGSNKMHPGVILAAVILFLFIPVFNLPAESVEISRVPESIDAFLELRNELAATAEGGASMFVIALYLYTIDEELGLQAITVTLVNDDLHLRKSSEGVYKGYAPTNPVRYLLDRVLEKPYISRSYFSGTSHENGYAISTMPLIIETSRNKYSEIADNEVKLFIASSGASSPRPVRLKLNSSGIWKVDEFSSLVVGVIPPEEQEKEDEL